jgi:hypothetical protein
VKSRVCPVCSTFDRIYAYFKECSNDAIVEFNCEASLSCVELATELQSPMADPMCGATAARLASTCGYVDGQTAAPDQCVAFCEAAQVCKFGLAAGACEYDCNLQVGGAPCTAECLDLYTCWSDLSCPEMQALVIDQKQPSACGAQQLHAETCM